jgi:hypothetical protein
VVLPEIETCISRGRILNYIASNYDIIGRLCR